MSGGTAGCTKNNLAAEKCLKSSMVAIGCTKNREREKDSAYDCDPLLKIEISS